MPAKKKSGPWTPEKNYPRGVLTKDRCDLFLLVLSKTGSKRAAAKAATPYGQGKRPGYSSFAREIKNNPEFAEAVENAYEEYKGLLDQTIHDRAFNPARRPIIWQGDIVAYEEKYDNNLLMQVARRHDEKWRDKSKVEHSGQVNHGVMVVGALPESDEEWEDQYALTDGEPEKEPA